jgi:hypothetical protein
VQRSTCRHEKLKAREASRYIAIARDKWQGVRGKKQEAKEGEAREGDIKRKG